MTVVSILMCANFASCSKDDEPKKNDSGVVSNEKKVVEITDYYVTRWGEQSHTIKFVYDEQKRLIKAKNSSDNYTEYYIWKENLIENYYGEDDNDPWCYGLNKGLVSETYSLNRYNIKDIEDAHKYNSSKQMISWTYPIDKEIELVWEKGNLKTIIKADGDTVEFYYSDKTCKGYFPLMHQALEYTIHSGLDYFWYELYYAHPELVGLRTKQLPDKVVEKYSSGNTQDINDIQYTFTDDGYIKTCTMTDSDNFTIKYYFKWQ